jgi:hypothetical protein
VAAAGSRLGDPSTTGVARRTFHYCRGLGDAVRSKHDAVDGLTIFNEHHCRVQGGRVLLRTASTRHIRCRPCRASRVLCADEATLEFTVTYGDREGSSWGLCGSRPCTSWALSRLSRCKVVRCGRLVHRYRDRRIRLLDNLLPQLSPASWRQSH